MGQLESSAVAFMAGMRHRVLRSIEIEQGVRQVARYREAGLITFAEDRREAFAGRVQLEPVASGRRYASKAEAAKRAAKLVNLMKSRQMNIKQAADELGYAYSTALIWVRKHGGYKAQLNADKLQRALRLINEESHSMTTAAKEIGCSLGALSNYLRKNGYKYDRETCLASRRNPLSDNAEARQTEAQSRS